MGALTTDERVNSQVELITANQGLLRAVVQPGDGGGAPTFIAVDMSDDQDFNGDGSGGAIKLSPITILSNATDFGAPFIWDFQNAGVAAGWVVLLAVDNTPPSTTPGAIEVRFNNVFALDLDDTTCPPPDPGPPPNAQFRTPLALYFNGISWQILANILRSPIT